MYTHTNFKSGAELRRAVAAGTPVTVFQPNADMFGKDPDDVKDGEYVIEGPHYPQPHRFYVGVTVKNRAIVKVKK